MSGRNRVGVQYVVAMVVVVVVVRDGWLAVSNKAEVSASTRVGDDRVRQRERWPDEGL